VVSIFGGGGLHSFDWGLAERERARGREGKRKRERERQREAGSASERGEGESHSAITNPQTLQISPKPLSFDQEQTIVKYIIIE